MDVDALKTRLGVKRDEDLASRLGIPRTLISDIRRNRRKPSLKMAAEASRLTGDPTYLEQRIAQAAA